ncbi:MAG: hypothetical protein RJA32_1321 [Pseudomonadota bacterium]|jgi:hypothetical protein
MNDLKIIQFQIRTKQEPNKNNSIAKAAVAKVAM